MQGGEKSGAEDYEEALQDTELSSDVHCLIETKLLVAMTLGRRGFHRSSLNTDRIGI